MIRRFLAALRYNFETFYCANCGGHFPASHFPCE